MIHMEEKYNWKRTDDPAALARAMEEMRRQCAEWRKRAQRAEQILTEVRESVQEAMEGEATR